MNERVSGALPRLKLFPLRGYLKPKEVARRLQVVGPAAVPALVKYGPLRGSMVGGQLKVHSDDIADFLGWL